MGVNFIKNYQNLVLQKFANNIKDSPKSWIKKLNICNRNLKFEVENFENFQSNTSAGGFSRQNNVWWVDGREQKPVYGLLTAIKYLNFGHMSNSNPNNYPQKSNPQCEAISYEGFNKTDHILCKMTEWILF